MNLLPKSLAVASLAAAIASPAAADTASQQSYMQQQFACAGMLFSASADHAAKCGPFLRVAPEQRIDPPDVPPPVVIDPCLSGLVIAPGENILTAC